MLLKFPLNWATRNYLIIIIKIGTTIYKFSIFTGDKNKIEVRKQHNI